MQTIHCRAADVNGLKISYRQAGRPEDPRLLLLHGSKRFAYGLSSCFRARKRSNGIFPAHANASSISTLRAGDARPRGGGDARVSRQLVSLLIAPINEMG